MRRVEQQRQARGMNNNGYEFSGSCRTDAVAASWAFERRKPKNETPGGPIGTAVRQVRSAQWPTTCRQPTQAEKEEGRMKLEDGTIIDLSRDEVEAVRRHQAYSLIISSAVESTTSSRKSSFWSGILAWPRPAYRI
jgi:hypothetical protein